MWVCVCARGFEIDRKRMEQANKDMEKETNRNSTETAKEGIAVECILIVARFCTANYIFFARWSFDGIQIHSLHPYEKHGIDQYRFFACTSKLIYAMKTTNSWRNLYLSKMLLSKAVCLSDYCYLSTQFLRIFEKCVASKFAIELRISPAKLNKQWAEKQEQ